MANYKSFSEIVSDAKNSNNPFPTNTINYILRAENHATEESKQEFLSWVNDCIESREHNATSSLWYESMSNDSYASSFEDSDLTGTYWVDMDNETLTSFSEQKQRYETVSFAEARITRKDFDGCEDIDDHFDSIESHLREMNEGFIVIIRK